MYNVLLVREYIHNNNNNNNNKKAKYLFIEI